jgi:hypothetical protein
MTGASPYDCIVMSPGGRCHNTLVVSVLQACLKHRYKVSALLAGWAVLFRQTNAVWVCFIIGVGLLPSPDYACNSP